MKTAVDLFAGPGGWDLAALDLGLDVIGIELDELAVATRKAAGLDTIHADVDDVPPEEFAWCDGLIASPPCQDWSSAGPKTGRAGASGHLVDLPLRWAIENRPRWIALEEVEQVLPVWRSHAEELAAIGYHVWTGVLDAAEYGVPQYRRRAILLAHLDRPVDAPHPTHGIPTLLDPGLVPLRTMLDVLPSWEGLRLDRRSNGAPVIDDLDRPSPTVTGATAAKTVWILLLPDGTHRRIELDEAAILQTFPEGYPFQGSRREAGRQIGNAVPPTFAHALLKGLVR